MTSRGVSILSVATLCASISLGGCAIPLAVSVASYTFDAFSLGVEGKSMGDLALSNVMGEDCSTLRVVVGDAICRDYSPEQQRDRDRFVAEAGTSNHHADRVDVAAEFYEPADKTDRPRTVLLAAIDATGEAAGRAADASPASGPISSDANIASVPLPLPAVAFPTVANSENPAQGTTESSTAVATPTLDEPRRSASLPRSAQTLPAVAALPALGANAAPTQLASAAGFRTAPKTNPPERPLLAPPLGLELDTMLLTESSY